MSSAQIYSWLIPISQSSLPYLLIVPPLELSAQVLESVNPAFDSQRLLHLVCPSVLPWQSSCETDWGHARLPEHVILTVQRVLEEFLIPEASQLVGELQLSMGPGFRRLNQAVSQLLDDWSMISFTALDYSDEESIPYVLAQASSGPKSLAQI